MKLFSLGEGESLMTVDKDVLAGAFFVLLGALGLWIGADYATGTAARMAAGFVPKLLCWALLGIGVIIVTTGFLQPGAKMERWELRPLVAVLLSLLIFAGLIESAGFIIATIGLVLVAAFGSRETRWAETVIFSVVLATVSALVFVKGLGLTMKIFPGV
jgi:hypothetical protein